MQTPYYFIETFGCQMNVYDSELVAGLLQNCGFSETSYMNQADIIFLNTCAIREKAEETVHHRLESLQHFKETFPNFRRERVARYDMNPKGPDSRTHKTRLYRDLFIVTKK